MRHLDVFLGGIDDVGEQGAPRATWRAPASTRGPLPLFPDTLKRIKVLRVTRATPAGKERVSGAYCLLTAAEEKKAFKFLDLLFFPTHEGCAEGLKTIGVMRQDQ